MDKQEFFNKLHKDLENKYHLTIQQIEIIRRYHFQRKFNKEQMCKQLLENLKLPRKKRHLSTKKRLQLINSLKTMDDKQFADITQKTEFDK
jgi:23S rRNA C2498 (ribose-2'-O)-methylase RlmM